ncbi:MAG: hypothetical protein COV59_04900 [Candidatus Magasanikbacteria bacterium CG11_big_fil_rev_8_21_14_0_20_39_34]|uniref:Uncharacterized protein n=1 Tax=Candidatus Magasanikbacteria bacterium CG11_big_fil_rev_8_21_14_0_20_39_34 TaxID=1974653 RepID=A0A2H0N3M6_9BACT|nr:MAG: hypothetical protein COV59_04900 [Candidatus Magasanikbacteria bacterium CG11_big_fil_rev_8_21_14_0_20_39_34]
MDERLRHTKEIIAKRRWSAIISAVTFFLGLIWIAYNQYQRIEMYNQKLEKQMEESQQQADKESKKIQDAIQKKIEQDLEKQGIPISE